MIELTNILDCINNDYSNLCIRINDLKTEIAKLTQLGTTQAKFYIRKDVSPKTGDTLETYYLLHPMKNGKRKKEYVGREKYQIQKAMDRMERFQIRSELIDTLSTLELKQSKALTSAAYLCRMLSDGSMVSSFLMADLDKEARRIVNK